MGENIDEAKGRAKEAAGDLTGDRDLKNEGKVDRGASGIKKKIDHVADELKERVGHRRDRDNS
ncbi:MAG: CsbD family protein [Solirubrobacterales bacterium]